jgi:uncharacterized Zn finger protein
MQDGGLVAWVEGTRRYATLVERDAGGSLHSTCTCPYEGVCKHAVAVVLEYLQCLERETPVPLAHESDERFGKFERFEDDDDDVPDDFEADGEEMPLAGGTPERIESFLEGKTRAELARMILDMADRYPPVKAELTDRRSLSEGKAGALKREIRREIKAVTSTPGWQNYWKRTGYIPDYSGLRGRLAALLESGYADETLALGEELIEAGIRHVEESNDEGETAAEFVTCMDVIAKALDRSSRPTASKLTWAMEMMLYDSYGLFGSLGEYLERPHEKKDWGAVADRLLEKLQAFKPRRREDEWFRYYERDRLVDWIILALTRSGRMNEVIPLCEKEAKKTGSYERLVTQLVEAGRYNEAEKWIFAGLKTVGEKWTGIGTSLRGKLLEIRMKQKDWLAVASLRVDEFLRRPSLDAYEDCEKATRRRGLWPRVRQGLICFLECGALPWEEKEWPLPATGLSLPANPRSRELPRRDVLIDIAIREKQPNQVLRWYDARSKDTVGVGWMEDRIATAVVEFAPDRAAALWKGLAEREIAAVNPSAYEKAAGYLRKLSGLLKKLDREAEWKACLAQLKVTHARKRRLMEILDILEEKPILKTM